MATSKTLTPTNVTISIPEFTDQPDQRVNSNCIDKEADAINALNGKIAKFTASDIKSSLSSQYGAIGGARGISIGTFRVIELDISISTQVPKYGDIITGLPGAGTNNIPTAMTNNTSGEVHYASITATGVLYAMFDVIPTGSYRVNLAYIGA